MSLNNELFIEKKNIPNIFKTDKILNISGVVGENGTGKTTLLNKLGGISDIKLKSQNAQIISIMPSQHYNQGVKPH